MNNVLAPSCGRFHKNTLLTYNQLSCSVIHCAHAPMQYFQNALAYFSTVVNYMTKLLMKLTSGTGTHMHNT